MTGPLRRYDLLSRLLPGLRLMFPPYGRQQQCNDDSNRDLKEAVRRNNPARIGTRDEHDDSERDAGAAVGAFSHSECGAQKSQRRYRCCKDYKFLSEKSATNAPATAPSAVATMRSTEI